MVWIPQADEELDRVPDGEIRAARADVDVQRARELRVEDGRDVEELRARHRDEVGVAAERGDV